MAIPSNVVIDIVLIALASQLFWKRKVPPFLGISYIGPRSQRAGNPDAVIIYLISSTKPATN